MNKRTLLLSLIVLGLLELAGEPTSTAQTAESRLERYMRFAHPIGSVAMKFIGPDGGYTFLDMPTRELRYWGEREPDTVVRHHTYLLDLNIGHEGGYLAPDTMMSISDYTPFEFALSKDHILHAKFAPGHSHEDMRALDTTFNGTIGWGLLRQFVTAFDFKKKKLTFYPLYANVDLGPNDTNTIQLPLLDDAKITYCGCPFASVWLDVSVPPLKPGRVNLAFHRPTSQIFTTALDQKTQQILAKQAHTDSVTGHAGRPLGLNIAEFIIGSSEGKAENIARRGAHREIAPLPAEYHDLNIATLGTLGTDVLKTFSAIIIDPSRQKLIFVR